MFKVGDYVIYINGKTKTTARVEIVNQIPNYIGVSTGENVYIYDCEYWYPEDGEVCIFESYEWDYPFIARCTDDLKRDCLNWEPFIGKLPSQVF